jgi:hypothetical protein
MTLLTPESILASYRGRDYDPDDDAPCWPTPASLEAARIAADWCLREQLVDEAPTVKLLASMVSRLRVDRPLTRLQSVRLRYLWWCFANPSAAKRAARRAR